MDGIDVPRVTAWFEEHIDAQLPLQFREVHRQLQQIVIERRPAGGAYHLRRQ